MPSLRLCLPAVATAVFLSGWGLSPAAARADAAVQRLNPLLKPSSLPFQAPLFDQIHESDYLPAFEAGMRQQAQEIAKIANDPAVPSFQNTYLALEQSGVLLDRVAETFFGLLAANSDTSLEQTEAKVAPELSAHQDAIYFNGKMFKRLDVVYRQRAQLHLDPESLRLVEVTHAQFLLNGAKLSTADQAKLRGFNAELSKLIAAFTSRLLAATKAAALSVSRRSSLAGLSLEEFAAAADAAKSRGLDGRWLLTLQNTTQQPMLAELADRATREALFNASWGRAEKGDANDTRELIERIAQLRAASAQLLGFPNYAAWKLADQMAKTPARAIGFMQQLVPAATARAKREATDIQQLIDRQHGGFKLAAWDWAYYADQVRKARYGLDDNQTRPYFELHRVLEQGVFYAAHQLYGLSFKRRTDLPVYQPDVMVYEVFDEDGQALGLFYADYFKRDNKSGGAWMDNFVMQSKLLGTKPVIYNVANFAKPMAGQPALVSFDDVITMFHEFGHALHGFLSACEYRSLSGIATARDFVEFPSQFNEHWALEPTVLAHYAKDYRTGAPMPAALADKLHRTVQFNKGYGMTEIVSAALLDMAWHTLPANAPKQQADAFEQQVLTQYHLDLSYVPPRYRSSDFLHIWGDDYAAGYYAYLWTQMLADDAFEWFKEHGGLTRANGERFRQMILSRGNTEDLQPLYDTWRGRPPSIEPMLIDRGLKRAD